MKDAKIIENYTNYCMTHKVANFHEIYLKTKTF